MVKDAGDPALIHTQPGNYTLVTIAGEDCPDERLTRYDPTNPSVPRAATPAEIAAFDAARVGARSFATSRQKDILATCALIVRARGIAVWNAMTTQQKVTATLAEADVWKTIRDFIDDKV